MARKRKALTPADWENFPDDELLRLRVRDLGLTIRGTHLEEKVKRLYSELDARGIGFKPPYYLADEWLCPDKVPVIGIPFFLAHPRLMHLERKMMLEVEGGTDYWCQCLLRHEAGHVLNYAYKLYTRTRWRELFGPFTTRYLNDYYAQPYSRRYVIHLEEHYAQAHPDEDFAETFAVWLNPRSNWQEKYREWPALKKLKYVDSLIPKIGPQQPRVTDYETPWSAGRMVSTLAAFYERRHRFLGDDFPGFYDPGLQRIFSPHPGENKIAASQYLRSKRRQIGDSVSMWTGQRKYDIDKLIRKLASRCDRLKLYMHKAETDIILEITAFVTAMISNIPVVSRKRRRRQ
jgi:hypothetical protein